MTYLRLTLFFIFFSLTLSAQTEKNDSLLNLANSSISDTLKLRLLNELTEATDDIKVWPLINRQAMTLAKKLILNDDAIIRKKAASALATTYNNEGIFYNLQGNAVNAFYFLQSSFSIREKIGTKKEKSETLHNLGTLYYDLGEVELASQYFNSSIKLSEEIYDSINAAVTLNYMGMIAIKENKLTLGHSYFEKSLHTFKNSGDEVNYATSLDNIGVVYYIKNDLNKALEAFIEAENIQIKYDNPAVLSTTYKNIGLIKFYTGNISSSHEYANLALEQAKKSGFFKELANAEDLLSKIYEAKKEYASAFFHFKNYIAYNDSIKIEESRKFVIAAKLKDGYEKKASVIKADQIKKDLLNKQELTKQKTIKNSFVIGVVLLLIFSMLLYSRFSLKKKSEKKLVKAYRELQHTQEQLLHQEKMASLGMIAVGISHEIQNPLNFVNNFSALSIALLDEFKNSSEKKEREELFDVLKKNMEKINIHGERASRIIKSILNQSHHSSNEKQLTDINQMCDEFLNLSFEGMKSNYPDFFCEIVKIQSPTLPKIDIVQQDVVRVLLNLFNNAFYAVKIKEENTKKGSILFKPRVVLTTLEQNNDLIITIRDNGNGIPLAIIKKIFIPFFTTKPAGEGTGLGLSISYDIIKVHGGEITVTSEENEFTEFKITLPL